MCVCVCVCVWGGGGGGGGGGGPGSVMVKTWAHNREVASSSPTRVQWRRVTWNISGVQNSLAISHTLVMVQVGLWVPTTLGAWSLARTGSRSLPALAHSPSGILALPGARDRSAAAREFAFLYLCVCVCSGWSYSVYTQSGVSGKA